MMPRLAFSIFLAVCVAACSGNDDHDDHDDHDHSSEEDAGHSTEGPHGGDLIEVGAEVAHLEVIHDEDAGTITFHVLGPDGKTAMSLADAPELKLTNGDAPQAFTLVSANDENNAYTITDDALKVHGPEGRITITLGGKTYNPELLHDHGH
tara:strand:- start:17514 stop:17966 length:453 start_codon:yes stop_codon:yes gene_type:complete